MNTVHQERDTTIRVLYLSGVRIPALCAQFNLTRGRIYQILQNVPKHRPVPRPETEYVGVKVTKETKDALLEEAERRGLSVSELTADALDNIIRISPAE